VNAPAVEISVTVEPSATFAARLVFTVPVMAQVVAIAQPPVGPATVTTLVADAALRMVYEKVAVTPVAAVIVRVQGLPVPEPAVMAMLPGSEVDDAFTTVEPQPRPEAATLGVLAIALPDESLTTKVGLNGAAAVVVVTPAAMSVAPPVRVSVAALPVNVTVLVPETLLVVKVMVAVPATPPPVIVTATAPVTGSVPVQT